MRRLPPLTAIEAFVQVARLGSVKAAAEALALSSPALTRRIHAQQLDRAQTERPLTDAAVLNEGAFGQLTGALTGENERADELIRLGRGALLGLAGVVALEHCESRHFYGVSPPIRYAYRIRRRV